MQPIESLEPRRLLAEGDPDPTFGVDGHIEDAISDNAVIDHALLLSNDKILLAGGLEGESGLDPVQYLLSRHNADGTLDTSFGDNGSVTGFFPDEDQSEIVHIY